MKKDIHPNYHDKTTITCSCGNVIETGSTAEALSVEVCSNCHPYYTGKHKLVDVAGRVDAFKKRMQKASDAEKAEEKLHSERAKKQARRESEEQDRPEDEEVKLG